MRIEGKGARDVFKDEAGGHRWQHVPKTEKRGRVQTSTITVAVLDEPTETQVKLNPDDLEFSACRGSGAGGQHRNVTASAVQLRHIPTGLMVRVESERSQALNRETATALLRARLWEAKHNAATAARAADRKAQVGVGARGDKRRTIAVQRDSVVDHVTGRSWTFKKYERGDW